MSLENLAKIGKLKQHSATREDAAKLLAAARRNLAETRIKELSPETRFDLACIRSAEALLTTLVNWLKQNQKEWAQ